MSRIRFLVVIVLLLNFACPLDGRYHSDGDYQEGGAVFFLAPGNACMGDYFCVRGLGSCVRDGISAVSLRNEVVLMDPDIFGASLDSVRRQEIPVAGCDVYLRLPRYYDEYFTPRKTRDSCDIFRQFICASAVLDRIDDDESEENVSMDITMESSLPISSCLMAQAELPGWDVEGCTSRIGLDQEQYLNCEVYQGVLDRIDECIVERGPQSLMTGYCFSVFRAADFDGALNLRCESCPWWSSKECFDQLTAEILGQES